MHRWAYDFFIVEKYIMPPRISQIPHTVTNLMTNTLDYETLGRLALVSKASRQSVQPTLSRRWKKGIDDIATIILNGMRTIETIQLLFQRHKESLTANVLENAHIPFLKNVQLSQYSRAVYLMYDLDVDTIRMTALHTIYRDAERRKMQLQSKTVHMPFVRVYIKLLKQGRDNVIPKEGLFLGMDLYNNSMWKVAQLRSISSPSVIGVVSSLLYHARRYRLKISRAETARQIKRSYAPSSIKAWDGYKMLL